MGRAGVLLEQERSRGSSDPSGVGVVSGRCRRRDGEGPFTHIRLRPGFGGMCRDDQHVDSYRTALSSGPVVPEGHVGSTYSQDTETPYSFPLGWETLNDVEV